MESTRTQIKATRLAAGLYEVVFRGDLFRFVKYDKPNRYDDGGWVVTRKGPDGYFRTMKGSRSTTLRDAKRWLARNHAGETEWI